MRCSLNEVRMRTNEISREQISALADGVLDDPQIDIALTALRQDAVRADWEVYHQIGDVLRSDDMAVTLSPGFAERMAARLDAEPTIVAPGSATGVAVKIAQTEKHSLKRWAAPSIAAAAAMAAIAFVTTPQLMVALRGEEPRAEDVSIAAAPSVNEKGAVVMAPAAEGVILRDPRIDDYLLAHQRLSPSVYSTAQYARSATFSSDSGK